MKTMNRYAALALIAVALGGCLASEDDVYVQTSSSRLVCEVGEVGDVCSKDYGSVKPNERPGVIDAFAAIAQLVEVASEASNQADSACRAALADLGMAEVDTRPCHALDEALAAVDPKSFTIEYVPATCTDAPSLPCMSPNATRPKKCVIGQVTVTEADGATDQERAIAKALQSSAAIVLLVKDSLSTVSESASTVVEKMTAKEAAPPCAKELATQLSQALEKTNELAKDTASLAAKLERLEKK